MTKIKNLMIIISALSAVTTELLVADGISARECKICHHGCMLLDGHKKEICHSACDATVCENQNEAIGTNKKGLFDYSDRE